jgi:hypothetical protein
VEGFNAFPNGLVLLIKVERDVFERFRVHQPVEIVAKHFSVAAPGSDRGKIAALEGAQFYEVTS